MIVKNKLILLTLQFGAISMMTLPIVSCACSTHYDIEGPKSLKVSQEIDVDNNATVYFEGFHFFDSSILQFGLDVESTFSVPGSTITTSIVDLDIRYQTFNVKVEITNALPGKISGQINFKIKGKKDKWLKLKQNNFTINLFERKEISEPELTVTTGAVDGGHGVAIFDDFQYTGLFEDPEQLLVDYRVVETTTIVIQSSIANLETHSFGVRLEYWGARVGDLSLQFCFYYQGKLIKDWGKTFTLHITDSEPLVEQTCPSVGMGLCTAQGQNALVTFTDFTFAGITDESQLHVESTFTRQDECKNFTAEIIDFNMETKKLSVVLQVPFDCLGRWEGTLSFYYNGTKELLTTTNLVLLAYFPLPNDPTYFTIENQLIEGQPQNVLTAINSDAIQSTQYNAFILPPNVNIIDDSVCDGKFGENSPIKFLVLDFALGLNKIGDYAFRNCTGLESEIFLPDSIQSIGISAFESCSNINYLTLPYNTVYNVSIGDFAFKGCSKLNCIDVSAFNQLPSWTLKPNNGIFIDDTHVGMDNGIVYVRNEGLIQSWSDALATCGLDNSSWTYIVKE